MKNIKFKGKAYLIKESSRHDKKSLVLTPTGEEFYFDNSHLPKFQDVIDPLVKKKFFGK